MSTMSSIAESGIPSFAGFALPDGFVFKREGDRHIQFPSGIASHFKKTIRGTPIRSESGYEDTGINHNAEHGIGARS
jgi:hypothetical protein